MMTRKPGTKTYRPSRDWWQRNSATEAAKAVKPTPFKALTDAEIARALDGLKSPSPTLDDVAAKVCGDVVRGMV